MEEKETDTEENREEGGGTEGEKRDRERERKREREGWVVLARTNTRGLNHAGNQQCSTDKN